MKKLKIKKGIGLYLLYSSLAVANPQMPVQSLEKAYESLEKEYANLIKKEENFFKAKENAAIAAQSKLNQQKALYEEISRKEQQINNVKNVRFYKEQYASLSQKYKQVMQELNIEMNKQRGIINEYVRLKNIKEGK